VALPERADDSEHFVVAKSGFCRQLDHKIWRLIHAVAGGVDEVIQTAARTLGVDEEICRETASPDRRLRRFHRETQRELAAEILGYAEAVLAGPAEAHGVLRIDGHRQGFGAVVEQLLGLRYQAPHLAAREGPSAFQVRACENLALPQHVAVALTVVRG